MDLRQYLFVERALKQGLLTISVLFKHGAKRKNGHSTLQVQMQHLDELLVLLIYLVKFEACIFALGLHVQLLQ